MKILKGEYIMRKPIKLTTALLASSLIITPIADIYEINNVIHAQTTVIKAIREYDKDDIDLKKLTDKDLRDIRREYNRRISNDPSVQDKSILIEERGHKSKAASVAARKMKQKLRKTGKKNFERNIPKWAKRYISYDTVMRVLDAVTGFSGSVEAGLTNHLRRITGLSYGTANMIAKVIVAILL